MTCVVFDRVLRAASLAKQALTTTFHNKVQHAKSALEGKLTPSKKKQKEQKAQKQPAKPNASDEMDVEADEAPKNAAAAVCRACRLMGWMNSVCQGC